MRASLGLKSVTTIEIRDAQTGRLLEQIHGHNRIVDSGLNALRDFLAGLAPVAPAYFAVGIGPASPVAGDVALESEVYRTDITQRLTSLDAITFRCFLPSTAANGLALTEWGLFDTGPGMGGTLFLRQTHTPIAKTSSITVTYADTIPLSYLGS